MPYVMGSVPLFDCLVRKNFLEGMASGHGEFVPAVAHAVRCVRGHSLWVQTQLLEPYGGVAFMVPIQALCWRPCAMPDDLAYVQPWDVFSSDFGVVELDMMRRSAVEVLPARIRGQYRFTLDFIGSDLAEHIEQHKSLHVCFLENGLVGAFPNNRLLWHDPAFWTVATELPKLRSLAGEFRAEGFQSLMRQEPAMPAPAAPVAEFVGEKKAKKRKSPPKSKRPKRPKTSRK